MIEVCNIQVMKPLLAEHGFHFSKAKGQNFLIAPWVPASIAEDSGVSRQAVWDNITRARRTMEDMEQKTGLIRRFEDQERIHRELEEDLQKLEALSDEPARKILREMEEKLQKLKG